jgi:hypothetical protein
MAMPVRPGLPAAKRRQHVVGDFVVDPHGERPRKGWRGLDPASAVAVTACVSFYLWRNVILAAAHLRGGASDFTNYYLAARAVLAGRSPFSVPNFDYPALMAFLVMPIAGLSEPAARVTWFVFGHLCLLAAAGLVWRRLGGGTTALVAIAAVWTFGGTVAENLVLGQVNPLLLVLLAGSWAAAWHARPRAATLIGGAAAVKLWPIVLLAKEALLGRWRAVTAGVIAAAALITLPWAFVAGLLPAPHAPLHASYWMGTPAPLNDSIPAVVLRLLEPPARGRPLPDNWVVGNDPGRLQLPASHAVAGVASGTVALVVGILLIGRCVRRQAPGRDDEPVVSAALVALALASAPIAWYHYQLLNFPGIAILVARWMGRRRFAALALLACMVVAGTWASSFLLAPYVARYGWTAANPAWLWFATSVTLVADLALFAALLRELGAWGPAHGTVSRD